MRINNNRNMKNNQGIYFKIEISCNQHGYEKNGNTYHEKWKNSDRNNVHIIVVKPHKVFISIDNTFRWSSEINALIVENFTNASNHDSCWKDSIDSKLHELSIASWKEAYKFTPEKHIPAPVASDITCSPCILNNKLLKFVEIETEYLPNDCYHYKMKKIKKISDPVILPNV